MPSAKTRNDAEAELNRLQWLLEGRDTFIVEKDLWIEFVEWVDKRGPPAGRGDAYLQRGAVMGSSEREERMEEALHHIKNWCEAYPVEVFPKPDLSAIREKIGRDAMSALHAYWARHFLEGIVRHAKRGLQNDV